MAISTPNLAPFEKVCQCYNISLASQQIGSLLIRLAHAQWEGCLWSLQGIVCFKTGQNRHPSGVPDISAASPIKPRSVTPSYLPLPPPVWMFEQATCPRNDISVTLQAMRHQWQWVIKKMKPNEYKAMNSVFPLHTLLEYNIDRSIRSYM